REFLDKDNYNEWSDQMKTYLIAKNMWDVVEADYSPGEDEAFKAWTKRNTTAFHAIRMSCSSDALSVIQLWIGSAKIAWATLATNFAATSTETTQSPANMYSEKYDCFFNDVGKGNWPTAKEFLTVHPEAIRVTSLTCNRTALHVAVSFGHLDIVKELVNLMTPEDLEIKEKGLGHTAFHIAVEKGDISMAKCMVEKNQNLLCITDHSDMIPIASVVNIGRKLIKMARYLYPLTVQQRVLFSHNGKNGAALIIKSIENSMFDFVFDLIKRCPHLIIAKEKSKLNPVTLISNYPTLFPSGYQLKFWEWWIYS
ncbi:hypothetical protein UlMin_025001, partial [Ulmus minor]